MSEVVELLKSIHRDYARDLGLDSEASYLHGTPLRPVVPLDHQSGGVFILGAYPSARFQVIDGIDNVPVADNLGPFESERWFDGSRVRHQASAAELQKLYFEPTGLSRSSCWVTDLVKVFLFKKGHRDKYAKLGAVPPEGYTRERFFELGTASVSWIERELEIAKPRLMITLGAEVAGILHGVRSSAAQTALLAPEVLRLDVGALSVSTIHCAHPGILMRRTRGNKWLERHQQEFIPVLREALRG